MKYLFELSKEHKTLPKAEVLTCLKAESIDYNVLESNEDVLIIETECKRNRIKRLAESSQLSLFFKELSVPEDFIICIEIGVDSMFVIMAIAALTNLVDV